jgi:hypothetical protein
MVILNKNDIFAHGLAKEIMTKSFHKKPTTVTKFFRRKKRWAENSKTFDFHDISLLLKLTENRQPRENLCPSGVKFNKKRQA